MASGTPIKPGDTFRVNFDRNNKQSPVNMQLAKVAGLNYENAEGVVTFVDAASVSFYLWPTGTAGSVWEGLMPRNRFGAFFVLNGGHKPTYIMKRHFTRGFPHSYFAR